MMIKQKTGKTKQSDTVQAIATATLLAQLEAAKTVAELKAVIVILLKRLGMG